MRRTIRTAVLRLKLRVAPISNARRHRRTAWLESRALWVSAPPMPRLFSRFRTKIAPTAYAILKWRPAGTVARNVFGRAKLGRVYGAAFRVSFALEPPAFRLPALPLRLPMPRTVPAIRTKTDVRNAPILPPRRQTAWPTRSPARLARSRRFKTFKLRRIRSPARPMRDVFLFV